MIKVIVTKKAAKGKRKPMATICSHRELIRRHEKRKLTGKISTHA